MKEKQPNTLFLRICIYIKNIQVHFLGIPDDVTKIFNDNTRNLKHIPFLPFVMTLDHIIVTD